MADEKLVEMLKRDVQEFNDLRVKDPWAPIDLTDALLDGVDLTRACLFGADLSRASLRGAILDEASLAVANLSEANLSEANLSKADVSAASFGGANLSKVALRDVTGLASAHFEDAILEPRAQAIILAAYAESFRNPT